MNYKLGVLTSHPIQYQAPLFRALSRHVDLKVYFAHRQTAAGQAAAGFNVAFDWDVDLLSGYDHEFLHNRASRPDVGDFWGCDTPSIARRIKQEKFDAVLVTGWHLKSYWQAILACRRIGVPVLVRGDSHLGTPRGRLKSHVKSVLYPLMLRQFDGFLYVGQNNRSYLRHYGVGEERLFFSPHCVDNDWFRGESQKFDPAKLRQMHGVEPNAMLVLFVGKLSDVKRPQDMVEALALLRKQGMPVQGMFAGEGVLGSALKALAVKQGVPVLFLGFRNQSQMPQVYRMADVLALPSSSETWGLAVNEALACGTPVVVSDAVGCVPDLVQPEKTGAAYAVGNVEAMAGALAHTLLYPPCVASMQAVLGSYTLDKAAAGVLDALRVVCAKSGRN